MSIEDYPNHEIIEGVLYRGEKTKRIIHPDREGVYKIRYQRHDYYHTLEDLLQTAKGPIKWDIEKEIEVVKDMHPSTVIDLHMKGMSTTQIIEETGYSRTYINRTKRKFVKINHFNLLCKNLDINLNEIRREYRLYNDLEENNLDTEDKLRLVSRYLREFGGKGVNMSLQCKQIGCSYQRVVAWLKKRNITYTPATFHLKLEYYAETTGRNVKPPIEE